jgi:tRNA uridine 5-carbamoylmethylation protein Kti12
VILDATNAKKEYRLDLIKPYRELYDEIDLVCFHIDRDLVIKQNKEREFPIPECALLKLIDAFEMPDEEEKEFFDHVDIITDHNIDKVIKRY